LGFSRVPSAAHGSCGVSGIYAGVVVARLDVLWWGLSVARQRWWSVV